MTREVDRTLNVIIPVAVEAGAILAGIKRSSNRMKLATAKMKEKRRDFLRPLSE